MSRIIKVTPNDDYTLSIELEHGNKLLFNMDRFIKTMRYSKLKDIDSFRNIQFEDKAVYWGNAGDKYSDMMSLRLTLDNILFALRD